MVAGCPGGPGGPGGPDGPGGPGSVDMGVTILVIVDMLSDLSGMCVSSSSIGTGSIGRLVFTAFGGGLSPPKNGTSGIRRRMALVLSSFVPNMRIQQ